MDNESIELNQEHRWCHCKPLEIDAVASELQSWIKIEQPNSLITEQRIEHNQIFTEIEIVGLEETMTSSVFIFFF